LLGANHPHHDRVDGLKVARVGGELDRDVRSRTADILTLDAEVVLDVTGALHRRRVEMALEFREDGLVVLAHDVRQHIESSTVRHSHHGRIEPVVGSMAENFVKDRNGRLGAFDTEPLGTDVLRGEELFKRLCCVQTFEDAVLFVFGRLLVAILDTLLDPLLLFRALNMHVLDADGAAVRITQHAEQVTEAHLVDPAHTVGEELAVEVPDREPVRGRIELARHVRLFPPQWVKVRNAMAAHAVHANQLGDSHLLCQHRLFAIHRAGVWPPFHRLVRHVERSENVVVEVVVAEQQFVHAL